MKEKSTLKDVANNYLTHPGINNGITLIALVITIIVLLILAGVTIATLTGDNGILIYAEESHEETIHATVLEVLQLETNEYLIEKNLEEKSISLIEYLREKAIIGEEIGTESGKYQINVEELLGEIKDFGNGVATEESKNDVYMLEENSEITGENTTYKVMYYGTTEEKNSELGELIDVEKGTRLIEFTIRNEKYTAEEGMTWEEFINSSYNPGNIGSFDGIIVYDIVVGFYIARSGNIHVQLNEKIVESYNYYGINLAECVYPDSNILIDSKGNTKQAQDIKENNNIIYFDFDEKVIKTGKVSKVYIHKYATNFVRYTFEDGSYLEATDYHPIYTKEGWKSLTNRNGYEKPIEGDYVKTETGWKMITKIEFYIGKEDCYDFGIISEEGKKIDNYFANGTLVKSSY